MIKLTDKVKKAIKNHAKGSMFRLNAKTADCYAFNLYINKEGKIDFEGSWDWSKSLIDKEAEYLYMLETDKFLKIIKIVEGTAIYNEKI